MTLAVESAQPQSDPTLPIDPATTPTASAAPAPKPVTIPTSSNCRTPWPRRMPRRPRQERMQTGKPAGWTATAARRGEATDGKQGAGASRYAADPEGAFRRGERRQEQGRARWRRVLARPGRGALGAAPRCGERASPAAGEIASRTAQPAGAGPRGRSRAARCRAAEFLASLSGASSPAGGEPSEAAIDAMSEADFLSPHVRDRLGSRPGRLDHSRRGKPHAMAPHLKAVARVAPRLWLPTRRPLRLSEL